MPYTPKPLTGGRFGVNETVYYQQATGENQKAFPSQYSAKCELGELPYERNLRVTEEWQQIDQGWFRDYPGKQPEEMLLRNEEGKLRQTYPTEQEKAETEARVVEVGVLNNVDASSMDSCIERFAKIKPGRSLRCSPQEIGRVWIRCRKGVARVSLILIPE